jgi:glycosyltransferase involved in cell wall biosynthesis
LKVSVAIATYRRAWALPYSLSSMVSQTRKPDEVIIVLKPSGDGSEEVISRFSSRLPIKLVIQGKGNFAQAYQMAINSASGDIILFIDDDAVAEERWVEKYVELFESLPDAGGIGGPIYTAYLNNNILVKTRPHFHLPPKPTRKIFYKKPLPEFSDYVSWLSISGFRGSKDIPKEGMYKSIGLIGANMGFRRKAIVGCPLATLYRKSRKCLHNEQVLIYCAKRKGFDSYEVRGSQAPVVWHIAHSQSLTRGKGFWHEFWSHYDNVAHYWRLKALGAKVSLFAHIVECLVRLRKRTPAHLLATLYAWLVKY